MADLIKLRDIKLNIRRRAP